MMSEIPANEHIDVIFARDLDAAIGATVSRPAVAVVPVHDSWNDFGLNFFAVLYILDDAEPAPGLGMRLMFQGGGRTSNQLGNLLSDERKWANIEQTDLMFCSLFPEVETYGRLVERLGFSRAISALRKLGDVVVLRLEGKDDARLALIHTEDFHLGALRQDGAYIAFRRGARHLRPTALPIVEDAASSFAMGVKLPSADNPYLVSFNFDPDELFRNRVSVLIGRNGTGKTQLLASIIRGLSSGTEIDRVEQAADAERTHFRPAPKCSRVLVFSSVTSDPYPSAIPPWHGIDYEYFSMTANREFDVNALTAALADCMRDASLVHFQLINAQHGGRLAFIRQVLHRIGIEASVYVPLVSRDSDEIFPEVRQWQGQRYFPLSRAHRLNEQRRLLLIQELEWKLPPVVFGLGHEPRQLSSGELAMFRFAAQAVAAIEPGSLILLDEPETHLHPNFISDFMELLQDLLNATQSVAIIATHSAYIVREVPRQRVRVLTMSDRQIRIDMPRLQTFGASIDSISQFVFGDTDVSHRYQEILATWLGTLGQDITIDAIINRFGSEMNPETLSYVAELLKERNMQ